MQKLLMQSFGPIKKVEMQINDIIILNGLQSSGKSTISKAIYFFKSIPELVFNDFLVRTDRIKDLNKSLVIACRKQLVAIFGTTKHMKDFKLYYDYGNGVNVTITPEKNSGHARIKFSPTLLQRLNEIAVDLDRSDKYLSNTVGSHTSIYQIERFNRGIKARSEIYSTFNDQRENHFIPAGRTLASTLSEELRGVESYQIDALTKSFVERILSMRESFNKSFDEIVDDKKKLTTDPIDFKRVKLAIKIIEKILQGQYKWVQGEERIELDENDYVKIKFSSSGQQESLWILLTIFQLILDNKPAFTVVEEPEAHLYPLTQYEIVKLLCLYAAIPEQQMVITTHSPYVMSSLNNHLLANEIGQNNEKVATVIDPKCWLDERRVSAYFVEKGTITDIFDRDEGMIDPSCIDRASFTINEDFDRLLDME